MSGTADSVVRQCNKVTLYKVVLIVRTLREEHSRRMVLRVSTATRSQLLKNWLFLR
jgi:transcriptional regulator of met regulon